MPLRLVFVGAVEFSRACLEALLRARAPLVGVVALPATSASRHSDYVDLAVPARAAGLPVRESADVNDGATLESFRAWSPDAILVLGWSQLLRPPALAAARLGLVGSHPALLPRNRGRHPIVWQLVNGETESGLTLFWLDETADSGPILMQETFPLSEEDDAGTFYRRMTDAGVRMMPQMLALLESGDPPRQPQDEALATVLRKRSERDGWVDWGRPAAEVHNLIRGLARPYVGASTRSGGRPVRLWRARRVRGYVPAAPPGTVLGRDPGGGLRVRAGDGAVELLESDPPTASFRDGEVFESGAPS
jgi:methionyl-tRNA formyltransferase